MGKPTNKTKKKQPGGGGVGGKSGGGARSTKSVIDDDTAIFISMAQELKEEGNKLFQKRNHEGAMLKYEKAMKLLPRNHIDVASLRTNMAACYMQIGIGEYPNAIRECNLALDVAPKYNKALLRRAKCYEGLNMVELAFRDANLVLGVEPGNSTALEMVERLRKEAEKLGIKFDDKEIDLGVTSSKESSVKTGRDKGQKKGSGAKSESAVVENGKVDTAVVVVKGMDDNAVMENGDVESEKVESHKVVDVMENGDVESEKVESHKVVDVMENGDVESEKVESHKVVDVMENGDVESEKVESHKVLDVKKTEVVEDMEVEVKVAVEEENSSARDASKKIEAVAKQVKLVLGEDIRCAQHPVNSSIGYLRDIVQDKFPNLKGILIKYRDLEGSGGKSSTVVENGKVDTAVEVDKDVVESAVMENGDVESEKVESHSVVDVNKTEVVDDKEVEVKVVVEEENSSAHDALKTVEAVTKQVKLVLGEDIRCAQYPVNSSIGFLRDIVLGKFPNLKGILIKYQDLEGDSVTITTTEELRLAESLANSQEGSFRLYITEVNRDQEPYEWYEVQIGKNELENPQATKVGNSASGHCIDDWIVHFAQLFKNHVGLDADPYIDFHEVAMKIYAEALEDAVTSEDAQKLFEIAAESFQEMAALAMFNWGNVHMSRARKWESVFEDGSRESTLEYIKASYDWAQKEYKKAAQRYEEAISIKPNFYEGYLALGRQQFEQAKLEWYYAVANKIELEIGPSSDVILLYNKAEDSMERGMLMWEELEERRLNGISKFYEDKVLLEKMRLDKLISNISPSEAAEQAANIKSQIYILWGTLLYERSVVEYRLNIPVWDECLEVAVEKFQLAGITPSDISVMIKNHISNKTALEGLWFKIDEIVQAWNEMFVAQKWQVNSPSFRLEPLFRQRIPRLHEVLEKL